MVRIKAATWLVASILFSSNFIWECKSHLETKASATIMRTKIGFSNKYTKVQTPVKNM